MADAHTAIAKITQRRNDEEEKDDTHKWYNNSVFPATNIHDDGDGGNGPIIINIIGTNFEKRIPPHTLGARARVRGRVKEKEKNTLYTLLIA